MKFLLFFALLFTFNVLALDQDLQKWYKDKWELTNRSIEYLYEQKILADAEVETKKNEQSFHLKVAAMHLKSCKNVLRTVSLFEEYPKWISFIKESKYDERNKLLTIKADHTLLPYPMVVHIIVERPTKAGIYPFVFPTGIFTGLTGNIYFKEHKGHCAFYAHGDWEGPDTKLPDFAIELFAETLTKLGGELIFRKIR